MSVTGTYIHRIRRAHAAVERGDYQQALAQAKIAYNEMLARRHPCADYLVEWMNRLKESHPDLRAPPTR